MKPWERKEDETVAKKPSQLELKVMEMKRRAIEGLITECPVRHHPATHRDGDQQHYYQPGGRVGCFCFDSEVPEGWVPTESQKLLWEAEDLEKKEADKNVES